MSPWLSCWIILDHFVPYVLSYKPGIAILVLLLKTKGTEQTTVGASEVGRRGMGEGFLEEGTLELSLQGQIE